MGSETFETIADDVTPLASAANGAWALSNLFLVILIITLCCGEMMILAKSDETQSLPSRLLRLMTIVPALFAVVACLVTQDYLDGDMILADMTTALLSVLSVLQLALVYIAHQVSKLNLRSA